jgi:class 3 adenylate cyclase
MGADEARTVRDLKGHQAVVLPMVGEFGGRIIDTAGDGILAEFASVVNAVKCAVAIQSDVATLTFAAQKDRKLRLTYQDANDPARGVDRASVGRVDKSWRARCEPK